MTITPNSSLSELAFIVCTALDQVGTKAILTGGAAANYYAPQESMSRDLDFILKFGGGGSASAALLQLGFKLRPEKHYSHESTMFTVGFPPGPIMIGDDFISTWDTQQKEDYLLHIISPTDSVKDRLAAYLHWNDFASLESALAVATRHREKLDLALMEDWSRREGGETKFEIFRKRLG